MENETVTLTLTRAEYLALEIALDNRAEQCADRSVNCDPEYWEEQERLADVVLEKLTQAEE